MAHVTSYKKWGITLGWWIFLSHDEACLWTSKAVSVIRDYLIGLIPGPWAAAAATAISVQSSFIRSRNEDAGNKGVKLLFLWSSGVITSVERLGTGRSPCGGASDSGDSGDGGGGGTPVTRPPKIEK